MTVRPNPEEYTLDTRLASWGRWRCGRGPGPSGRNTRPGREASRHSPQSASWSELDGGLDTARQSAPRRRSQVVSRAGQPISPRPSLSSFPDIW